MTDNGDREMNDEPEFARIGTWAITTPGAFIGYVADEQNAAIAFVVEGKEQFDDGTFIQLTSVIQIPNGHVQETIDHVRETHGDKTMISKMLVKLMEAGLVR